MTKQSYFPKPIRGQAFPGYTKVSRSQVKKYMEAGNTFNGFLVGNRVNWFHFHGGWHLAYDFYCESFQSFQTTCNNAKFYLEPELGNNIAIYLKNQ